MFKTISKIVFVSAMFVSVAGCEAFHWTDWKLYTGSYANEELENPNVIVNPQMQDNASIVVCRSRQCAPANLSMSREYVYNSLLQLFDNNNYNKALLCEADPASHVCLDNYITLPMKVGVTPTNGYIDYVKLTDVVVAKGAEKVDLILNYNLTYGGQSADCTPSKSILFARSVDHVLLEDAGYSCNITTIGQSIVKTIVAIDYIDLDYGYVGGYYSIGVSGPAYGGANGYMVIRMPKNAYPLSPALMQNTSAPAANAKSSVPGVYNLSEGGTEKSAADYGTVQIFPIIK